MTDVFREVDEALDGDDLAEFGSVLFKGRDEKFFDLLPAGVKAAISSFPCDIILAEKRGVPFWRLLRDGSHLVDRTVENEVFAWAARVYRAAAIEPSAPRGELAAAAAVVSDPRNYTCRCSYCRRARGETP